MSLVNSQSRVPPGFRFHPTEEELLHYYLRKKVACERIDLDVIREIDLNKVEPWDIQEACKIGSTPQSDWYFFSHKDKKYPTGCRTNRATAAGFWKATGRDKVIYSSSKRIGMRKTLVFYMGRAPHGLKSDWIMHEYRLEDDTDNSEFNASSSAGEEDGWVVCRVFKKKNIFKTQDSPRNSSMAGDDNTQNPHSSGDGDLDHILQYMRRACKMETGHQHQNNNPSITHQNSSSSSSSSNIPNPNQRTNNEQGITNWAALDRLVASHLNGQSESFSQLFDSFNDVQDQDLSLLHLPSYNRSFNNNPHDYIDVDLWNFTLPSSSIFATCQDHPSNLTKFP